MGVGTSSGHAMLYDIRSSKPMVVTRHRNNLPVINMTFHRGEGDVNRVISADAKILKIWDKNNGDLFAAIEGSADINDVCAIDGSGLMFCAAEQKRVQTYYVPALGPAPKWCSFIDSITEELEEEAPNIYADYKFITKEELEKLGLSKMLGTQYLRAYMHGYFINMKLYNKVKDIADPYAFLKYKKQMVQAKLDEKTASRIHAIPKKSDRKEKEEIENESDSDSGTKRKEKKTKQKPEKPVVDGRFSAMYTNPEFEGEKDSAEAIEASVYDNFEEEDLDQDMSDHDSDNENDDEKSGKGSKLYSLKSGHQFDLLSGKRTHLLEQTKATVPLGKRVETLSSSNGYLSSARRGFGSLEVSFVPQQEKSQKEKEAKVRTDRKELNKERRGVRPLKLTMYPEDRKKLLQKISRGGKK
eukprot:TRINITY_DN2971_c0_g1_i1.p1 TRINITY_DN2971_c0_g1~~TRINITY_DN2971_c0_g1_i1.p1  ORF type:complete len:413 (+),score=144.51 TRINITY_DN2971_c0_g1_i1:115-1353(+)